MCALEAGFVDMSRTSISRNCVELQMKREVSQSLKYDRCFQTIDIVALVVRRVVVRSSGSFLSN